VKFHRSSIHLGKLIVAIGNTEPSKKTAPYKPNQEFIKTFYSSGRSYFVVEVQYHRNFVFVLDLREVNNHADWIHGSKEKLILI
jgi:hypothetical protein